MRLFPGRNSMAMHTNVPGAAAVRAALASLIDYAGLFPPAQLPMGSSVSEYIEARASVQAWMLGRFIVPASRIDELLGVLGEREIAVSVIVDAGNDARTWLSNVQNALTKLAQLRGNETRVRMEALEIPLPTLLRSRETYDASIGQFAAVAQQIGMRDLEAFVEVPHDARWEAQLPGALAALARHRFGGKIRCGGVVADAVPVPHEVATFIALANEERVPFKATAGLHHPVRHYNEAAGFTMHGFLNLLAAAALARGGASTELLSEVIASEDPAQFQFQALGFAFGDERASIDDIESMRRDLFVGYGSCSFSEPIEDLQHLGLL